jgi:hydroxyacyl-ACP dehydratase HTD2-like protein with hotdog domain
MSQCARRGMVLADVKEGARLPELTKDVKPVTVVLGAMASRDWRPQHHDYQFATEHNGLDNIIMNTPNLAAWFERYLTDWSGPKGRLGRIKFRMKDSVYPGETMRFIGSVKAVGSAENDVGWVDVTIELRAGEKLCVGCEARIAIPATPDANPWKLKGEAWNP